MLAFVIFLLVLLLGAGLFAAIRITGQKNRDTALPMARAKNLPSAQRLVAISQPYREILSRAIEVQRDISETVRQAPEALHDSLGDLDDDIGALLHNLVPQAENASRLQAQILRLEQENPQRDVLQARAKDIEDTLQSNVQRLEQVRQRVWDLLDGAQALSPQHDAKKIDARLLELESLQEALTELQAIKN